MIKTGALTCVRVCLTFLFFSSSDLPCVCTLEGGGCGVVVVVVVKVCDSYYMRDKLYACECVL